MNKYAPDLSEYEYARCFNTFKKSSTEWHSTLDWLRRDFLPSRSWTGPIRVLSIGSGTGDFDLRLMRMVVDRCPIASYIAVDPNTEHNRIFRERFQKENIPIHQFEILPETFPGKPLHGQFHLIHLTHCLYYIPERRAAIREALAGLRDDGCLLIFHQTPLGINEIQQRFLKRAKGHENEMFSSKDVYHLLEDLGIPFTFDIMDGLLDISDCLTPGSSRGKRLIDFFLECRAEGLPSDFQDEVLGFIKELAFQENGRQVIFHPVGVFCISRPEDK